MMKERFNKLNLTVLVAISVFFVVLGFTLFPLIAYEWDGIPKSLSAMEIIDQLLFPYLLFCPLFAIIALFANRKKHGWWWIVLSFLGTGALILIALKSSPTLVYSLEITPLAIVIPLLLAVISPFIGWKKRGWWWIGLGTLGTAALGSGVLFAIIFVKYQAEGTVLIENAHVESMKLGAGSYLSLIGMIFLILGGDWDILQKRKQRYQTLQIFSS